MWSLRGEERVSNSNSRSRTSSSMSKSSSSSSQSQSPFSASSSAFQNPRARTMEEVWKDINGSPSIQEGHHCTRQARGRAPPKPNNAFQHGNTCTGTNIQEFLARPFSREPPSGLGSAIEFCRFRGPAHPPPPISLCLNTLPELQNSGDPPLANHSNDASGAPFGLSSPFDAFGSAFAGFNKKRGSESEENTGDRRHKRMIKNRESAARSRARKQSYTNELEFQVDYLTKENERLLKQQQQLCLAAAAQVPQKRTLHRTSTAPF